MYYVDLPFIQHRDSIRDVSKLFFYDNGCYMKLNVTECILNRSMLCFAIGSRKKPAQDGLVHLCPVCGVTIRPGELSSHLKWEMDKVDKVCR